MSHDDCVGAPPLKEVHHLAKKLGDYDHVSEDEIDIVQQAVKGARHFEAGQDVIRVGDRPSSSSLLVEGWAARSRMLEDGSRQITAINVPGDFVDLHSFLLHVMDHNVVALTPCRFALVPHEALRRISVEHPHLSRLFWLSTLIDASIHRNWIVALGRMPAPNRMAHLACELYVRLEAIGLANSYKFELPLTQVLIADVLGLSLVHVSRSLREIRSQGLLSWRNHTVEITDWERLVAFSQFDPIYLSLRCEPR